MFCAFKCEVAVCLWCVALVMMDETVETLAVVLASMLWLVGCYIDSYYLLSTLSLLYDYPIGVLMC